MNKIKEQHTYYIFFRLLHFIITFGNKLNKKNSNSDMSLRMDQESDSL